MMNGPSQQYTLMNGKQVQVQTFVSNVDYLIVNQEQLQITSGKRKILFAHAIGNDAEHG